MNRLVASEEQNLYNKKECMIIIVCSFYSNLKLSCYIYTNNILKNTNG